MKCKAALHGIKRKMKQIHHFTSDEKLKWWGYGEWVEEPDEVLFCHNGIECKIIRIIVKESTSREVHVFGGHLCGYVKILENHPFYKKKYDDIDISVHYGLTFSEMKKDGYFIGFDCGHYNDVIPSMRYLDSCIRKELENLENKFGLGNAPIFQKTYRNISFVIEECKSMADQVLEYSKGVKSELD